MICRKIALKDFKCHTDLQLPLAALTVLTGFNSAGKSTVLQALCLLSQTVRQDAESRALVLNGDLVELGTMADVLSQSAADKFALGAEFEGNDIVWTFSGSRKARTATIDKVEWHAGAVAIPYQLRTRLLGLLPEPGPEVDSVDSWRKNLLRTMCRMTYVGPERLSPKALYEISDGDHDDLTVGRDGTGVASILYYRDTQEVQEALRIEGVPLTLPRQVEARMATLFPGFAMQLLPVEGTNYVTLRMRTHQAAEFALPQNVGFGLCHVLPIVTACLQAEPGDIVLLDNPEAHLHPAGQAQLARFLADVSATGVQVILETHSDHILNGVRIAVKNGNCAATPEGVRVHFFSTPEADAKGGGTVQTLTVDCQGNMDHWPSGFCDQYEHDLELLVGWA